MTNMDLDFEIMFFESRIDDYKRYEANIRRFIANLLFIEQQFVELQQKKEEQFYRGEIESNVFRLIGKVRENKTSISELQLLILITEYCHRNELNKSLISFNSSTCNSYQLLHTNLRSKDVRNLHSLHFGTLLKLKYFVPHLQLSDNEAKLERANVAFGDRRVDRIDAIFEHYKKRLLIDITSQRTQHQFIVNYSSINYIVISMVDKFWTIYLVLETPALLYEVSNVETVSYISHSEMNNDNQDDEEYETPENKVRYTKTIKHLRKTTLFENIKPIVFTKSNVIAIRPFTKLQIEPQRYWRQMWSIVSRVCRFSKTPVYIGKIQQLGPTLGDVSLPVSLHLPYNVHHAFQCLDNASYQMHDELYYHFETGMKEYSFSAFVDLVKKLCKQNEKATELALYDLFYMKDHNIPVDCFYALENRFEERRKMEPFKSKQEHLVEVRRCILTPTREVLLPPLPYQKSRFLRDSNPDFALRVYAKDDNYNYLNFTVLFPGTPEHCEKFLKVNLFSKLHSGMRLKDRHYEYLGSSTSQLRDIGMMFYARDSNEMDANRVREEIGDLSHIKNPAKYIARIGQAFSQPMAFLNEIDSENVTIEADITGGFNPYTQKPYNFSDGVGMISHNLATKLTFLVDKNRHTPYSAFQIRYGGSKGMLTLNPKLTDTSMVLRESMKKFNSSSSSIDVLKVSNPRYVYLNRPFVNILEQLGVDASVFLSLAREQFQKIVNSFSCKCKALEVIKSYSQLELNYAALNNCEIDIFGEIFFCKIQEIIVQNMIKLIKSSARIQLPASSGRTMFGVLDETRTLKEGQVFVQYSQFDNYAETTVVTGEILVTKFPCMHPGDVRKFTAVDIPDLHHICDCIVFPQQGKRPHPDMMSGSDLDGDEYAVIWDEAYHFKRKNYSPMQYPSANDAHKNRSENVQLWEMLQFYVDFIQKDNVGVIASSHLALSDFRSRGIFHRQCLLLSKQYPIALDYAKSGSTIKEPTPHATFYPDFMEKCETKPTYKSERALGKLYRLSCLFEDSVQLDKIFGEHFSGNERLLTFRGWEDFSEQAENAYNKYRGMMLQIQRQFGIEDEFSLISGVLNKIQKYVCSKNERSDVKEMINLLVREVVKEMKEYFTDSLRHFVNSEELLDRRRAMASAWYLVTRRINENNDNAYYGLPWIVVDVLCDVAHFNSKSKRKHVCVLNIDVHSDNKLPGTCNVTIINVKRVLLRWLKNTLKTFRGFQYFAVDEYEVFNRIFEPIVSNVCSVVTQKTDIAIQQILRKLSHELKSCSEFENMLALSASLTLRRFRQTRQFVCLTQRLSCNDDEKDTWVTCLAYNLHPKEEMSNEVNAFRNYLRKYEYDFFRKVKESGIEDVCCQVYDRFLFVSAYGKVECLKKLRNALTRKTFYVEVVNNISLRFG